MIFNFGVKCINEIADDDIWIQKKIKKKKRNMILHQNKSPCLMM